MDLDGSKGSGLKTPSSHGVLPHPENNLQGAPELPAPKWEDPDWRIPVAVLESSWADGQVERALVRALRKEPDPGSQARAAIAARSLGTACWRGRLDRFLSAASLPLDAQHRVLAYSALIEKVPSVRSPSPVEAMALAGALPTWPDDPVDSLSEQLSLPRWIAQLWTDELGAAEAWSLAQAVNSPGPLVIRCNRLKCDPAQLQQRLAADGVLCKPWPRLEDALEISGRMNVYGSPAWRDGWFEVQDPGSQAVAIACAPQPGERWLDLCAGAGGKTLALASAMRGEGEIVAADIDVRRLAGLKARVRRAGAKGVTIVELKPGREDKKLPSGSFDGILVDAPCSELGTLRRHPGARWRIQPEQIAYLPELQRRLVSLALERGEVVFYATCTLRRAENEEVIASSNVPFGTRTLFPHKDGTDGFFVAWTGKRPSNGLI
jgi:16S rRNA (cytosine967-C5)-methyltransferase